MDLVEYSGCSVLTTEEVMQTYSADVEKHMVNLFDSLSEKDRRRYAAVEAEKLGHCGIEYVASLFHCDADTIRQGRQDVEQLPQDAAAGRVRQKGGPEES
jgi:hypothetical protein